MRNHRKLITDEILEAFAVVAEPSAVARELAKRFGGKLDRIVCSFDLGEGQAEAIETLQKA